MTNTEHYNLARPDPANDVDEEFYRLQQTLDQLDGIIFALKQLVDQKAAAQHGHTQADIVGLVDALASKMNANTIFSLDDLSDVDGASGAAINYLLVRGSDGQWRPSSAAAALGNHQHSQSDIVGLAEALTLLAQAIDLKASSSAVSSALADKQDRVASTDQDMNGRDLLNLRKINGGPLSSFRNKLINGDFGLFQRVAVPVTGMTVAAGASLYVADRWIVTNSTNQPVTVSRQSHTLGQSAVPGRPAYKMRLAFATAPTTGTVRVSQRVEGVEVLDGSVSGRGHFSGPIGAEALATEVVQNFGTGGAPSVSVVTAATSLDVATIYNAATQVRKAQFTIPPITGKVLGSNLNDFLELAWVLTPRQVGNYEISHLSLVDGDAGKESDPFSSRHSQQELALCQRYYETGYSTLNGYGLGGNFCGHTSSYRVQKRALPTVSPFGNGFSFANMGSGTLQSTLYGINVRAVMGATGNFQLDCAWQADAEI